MQQKIKLFGFNNLTKSLSFNIFNIGYASNEGEQRDFTARINERYNAEHLTGILTDVADIIHATVLNMSRHDYDPQGASATLLISEETESEAVVAHLDKSHIAAHTYPEYHPSGAFATFRVDIDVATCGEITPLNTLDYLIHRFDADIITIDYKVRGFTRTEGGEKIFIDHTITSVQDFIDKGIRGRYAALDINMRQANIFHTKMIKKEMDIANHIVNAETDASPGQRRRIEEALRREMTEIFDGSGV